MQNLVGFFVVLIWDKRLAQLCMHANSPVLAYAEIVKPIPFICLCL